MLTKKDHSAVLFFFFLFLHHVPLHVNVDILYQRPSIMTILKHLNL